MATLTKTIGTSSRDYSTIQAWEDDLDDGTNAANDATAYSSGDDAVGECYNDSVYDETVLINGGGTVGLNSVRLSVASGERHDGTAGSGARIVRTGTGLVMDLRPLAGTDKLIVEWLEIDANGTNTNRAIASQSADFTRVPIIRNMIIHDALTSETNAYAIHSTSRDSRIQNCIIYDWGTNSSNRDCRGIEVDGDRTEGGVYNCTVYNVTATGSSSFTLGIKVVTNSANGTCKNNLVAECHNGTDGANSADFIFGGTNTDSDYNLSTDDTADDGGGSNNLISKVHTTQFVSVTGGSEDLHLKSGADAIDAGVDLGTTPTNVNIDINGRDRDSEGDTWDIGAHEFVSSGTNFTETLSDTMTLADLLLSETNYTRSLTDTITLLDVLVSEANYIRNLTDIQTIIDSLVTDEGGTNFTETLSDSINLADALVSEFGFVRNLSDSLTLTDNFVSTTLYNRALTDSFDIADTLAKGEGKSLADTFDMSDELVRSFEILLNDSLSIVDSLVKGQGIGLSDTQTIVDNVVKHFVKVIVDSLGITDVINVGAIAHEITLSDTMTITDLVSANLGQRILKEFILVSEDASLILRRKYNR